MNIKGNSIKKAVVGMIAGAIALSSGAGTAGAINNGYNASPNAVTNSVSRLVDTSGSCTGTLIDKQWIITARHCIPQVGPKNSAVSMGTTMYGNKYVVEQYFPHESADIALGRLNTISKENPVPLYNSLPSIGTYGKAYGWGNIQESWNKPLQQADVRVNSYKNNYIGIKRVGAESLGGSRYQNGDSGGPLVINNAIAGVLSTGTKEQGRSDYGQAWYVPVADYSGWINDTISKNSQKPATPQEVIKAIQSFSSM